MAAPKKLLVLDLGMQSLRLAEFTTTSTGALKLLRAARREFLLDPALDTSRPNQTQLAVQELMKEWKLRTSDVVLVLPAHTVFSRVVPLDVPGGASGPVDAVVRFEAQQNIPFPLDDVVWDYVVKGETLSGAVNIVFVAVKTDILESFCHSVTANGLKIISITVAPLALYDALRYAYPEQTDSTTLLLDIGSRTSNLVIAAPGSFFSRSIPSGGLAVTTAIAKDIHASLEEAEHLKVTRGSVALGAGFEPPADPIEANLARIARQSLLKTQADISRSLSYYRSNMGGSDPKHILLTGGMASMPYLAEFLNEKLQKEVSFFNPLHDIPGGEIDHSTTASFIASNPNNLGELVGGALELIPGTRTSIKLLTPSLTKQKEFAKRLPHIVGAMLLFLAALTSWYVYALKATTVTRDETARITSSIAEEQDVSARIQKISAEQSVIGDTATQLLSAIRLREAYPMILADLSARVPTRFLWITEIQPVGDTNQKGVVLKSSEGQGAITALLVKGLYLDNPRQASVIDDLVTSLQSSEIFAVEEKEKSKIITQRGSPSGEYWAYPFSLKIPLRTPITPFP
mgnify:CR=1 FL=1